MLAPGNTAELLRRELGSKPVIATDDDRLDTYSRDESICGAFMPECAVVCETAEQVSTVLSLADEHGFIVTPRGAGSGKTGGALPVRGGVVLSTERMQKIVDIDDRDLVAVVEPGLITGDLQSAVETQGLFYPPDPASLSYCSIGGNVACNAGGPRAFKYGVTKEYVLGMNVALMGGEQLSIGRRTSKGVTGYDLTACFVGSEGTFGVITELVMKLLPAPAEVQTILAVFPSMEAAGNAIDSLIRAGFRPRTLEIADRTSIDHIRGKARYTFPKDAGAIALIEIDGEAESLDNTLLRVGQFCDEAGAVDVIAAQTPKEGRELWEARRLISSSLREAHKKRISEDICVPRGAVPEMLKRIDKIGNESNFQMATFGHAGDGNLHVSFLVDDDDPEHPSVTKRLDIAIERLFRETIELNGTLSGEHGIGLSKQQYMPLEQSESVLEWQRRLKRFWDPKELLNPGKIFPAVPKACHE